MQSMKKTLQVTIFALLSSLSLGLTSAPVEARTTAETAYSPGEVWSTAIRFLRIDRGYQILERDAEAGYVLFGYVDGETKARGSFEILSKRDDKEKLTTVLVINIPDVPRHVERLLLDKLDRKLREELGAPSPIRRDPPKDDDDRPAKDSDKGRDDKDKKQDGRKGDLPRANESELPQAEHRKDLPR